MILKRYKHSVPVTIGEKNVWTWKQTACLVQTRDLQVNTVYYILSTYFM